MSARINPKCNLNLVRDSNQTRSPLTKNILNRPLLSRPIQKGNRATSTCFLPLFLIFFPFLLPILMIF